MYIYHAIHPARLIRNLLLRNTAPQNRFLILFSQPLDSEMSFLRTLLKQARHVQDQGAPTNRKKPNSGSPKVPIVSPRPQIQKRRQPKNNAICYACSLHIWSKNHLCSIWLTLHFKKLQRPGPKGTIIRITLIFVIIMYLKHLRKINALSLKL